MGRNVLKFLLFSNFIASWHWIAISVIQAAGPMFERQLETPFPPFSGGSLAWADFDNDGDLDLLVTGDMGTNSPTQIFRNTGGTFAETGIRLPAYRSSHAEWADFNNDGYADLVLSGLSDDDPLGVRVYRNEGGTNLVLATYIPEIVFSRATWGDYNHDGWPDLAVTGMPLTGIITPYNRLFRNEGGTNFVAAGIVAPELYSGTMEWADYDLDGDLDLLITGDTGDLRSGAYLYQNIGDSFTVDRRLILASSASGEWFDGDNDGRPDLVLHPHSVGHSVIFRNTAGGQFVEGPSLPMLGVSSVGDFDNDGFSDILILGYRYSVPLGNFIWNKSSLYQHAGGTQWIEWTNQFLQLYASGTAWGDYDNDGRLDQVFQALGVESEFSHGIFLFRNIGTRTNTPPVPPSDLRVSGNGERWSFSWNAAHDGDQAGGLTYNIRLGTQPGLGDVVSPMSAENGYRRVPRRGNAEGRTNFVIRGLRPGQIYYWSVQAVDNAFAGSAFAPEQTLCLPRPPTVIAPTNVVSREDEEASFPVELVRSDCPLDEYFLEVTSLDEGIVPSSSIHVVATNMGWRVSFLPATNANGSARLRLGVTHSTGLMVPSGVTLTIVPVNDRPTTLPQELRLSEDSSVAVVLRATDPDGDDLHFFISRAPIHGILSGEPPLVSYRPETNYFGLDRFSFLVNDGKTNSLSATVELDITPVVDVKTPVWQTLLRADGFVEMRFHGEPRQIYWLERSDNLVDWKVDSLLQSPTGDLWINDPAASSQQYFRLRPLE